MNNYRSVGSCVRAVRPDDCLDRPTPGEDRSLDVVRWLVFCTLALLLLGFAPSSWAQRYLTATPNSGIVIEQGSSATTTLGTRNFVSGERVALSVSSTTPLPAGITVSFNPQTVYGNTSSTLTIFVGPSAPLGDRTLRIRGAYRNSLGGTSYVVVDLYLSIIPPPTPDFILALSQSSVEIVQGGSNSTTVVNTSVVNGFSSDITLSVDGLPTGVTASFISTSASPGVIDPPVVSAPGTGELRLSFDVAAGVPTGSYYLTVNATGGGQTHAQDFVLTVNAATGGWNDFNYIYDSFDDVYSNRCTDSYPAAENCNIIAPWDTDWRMRAAAVNVMYYNPDTAYTPWSSVFANASFTAARSNPQSGQIGYDKLRNLTGLVYEVAIDDSGFSGTRPQRGVNSNKTTGANGLIDLWDTHKRYTVNAGSVTIATYTYNNITSTGLNPAITTETLSDAAVCYPQLGGGDVPCRTIAQAQQNIANWFQYYRRRSFVAKSAISKVISGSPSYRYGLSLINESGTLFRQMPAAADTPPFFTHNTALLDALYRFVWLGRGTPLQAGLRLAGRYYDGSLSGSSKPSPITSACQKNFTALLTDGYWNASFTATGNVDGDPYSNTLADVARYYYKTDLRSGLPNNVPTDAFDTATWQHMVTFGISFGIEGNLVDTDGDGWPNPPLVESSSWGDPSCTDCPQKVDDIWHAAYNSRGTFVAAQTPADVEKALSKALGSISDREASSAAVATNSTRLDTDTLIYQAQFDSVDWTGRLIAFHIDSDGSIRDVDNDGNLIEEAAWDTDNPGIFPAYMSRKIYTIAPGASAGTFRGVLFANLADLTPTQQTALIDQDHLNWVRGDRSQEGGALRKRSRLLGDIVNSNPAYVGAFNFGFENLPVGVDGQSTYVAFRESNRTRTPMLYVAANDGMLHAFNAATGIEQFAFIPNSSYAHLAAVSGPNYTHRYVLDGSPQAGDAYINGGWKTILVGSAGAGGRSIFALDVTTPGAFDENKVLWEFTDPDLGYPIGQFVQPVISRMKNGDWAVIFGNGYESTNGKAFLFVVNLATGALIKKIDTGVGSATTPNGLAGPVLLADDNQTIKYAYAGDLQGNLWKFNLYDTDTANWDVAFKQGTTKKPLFQARHVSSTGVQTIQPITSPPEIGFHPDSGYLILFGTGKFFETGDNAATTRVQSLYGIWDKDNGISSCTSGTDACVFPTDRSTLQQQTIIGVTNANGYNWRIVSKNTINWGNQRGWYMDLPSSGERSASVPLIRFGRGIFTTIIPSSDVCSAGGTSWLMEVDMITGGRTQESVLDVNQDKQFDDRDNLSVAGVNGSVPVSGIQSAVGIINTPSVIPAGQIEFKFAAGSTGGIMGIAERGSSSAAGRQSWRQLR